ASIFETLKIIAVDEWHELMGGKRGVQVELAIAHIMRAKAEGISYKGEEKPSSFHLKASTSIWGISATIGNLEEAKEVLLSPL
ncbi:hypothetical protein ABTE85_22345, partial [Acinetobacter baumannii]